MANNALAPNIDNVLSDYVYAGRKLKEQRTNNMLNPQVQAALNYLKSVGSKFTSLNTPQDMSLGETAADIGLGFVPGIGTAQGARDFERARRENDYLGMGLSAASMLPVVGGVVKAGEKIVPNIIKIGKADPELLKVGKNIFEHQAGHQIPESANESIRAHREYQFSQLENQALPQIRKAIIEQNAVPITLKDNTSINLVRIADENDAAKILAVDNKGKIVGDLSYVFDQPGFNPDVVVSKDMQRKGIATAMYDLAHSTGAQIPEYKSKNAVRTEEGQAFRKAYFEKTGK